MRYSCFDPSIGLYHVYENDEPLNYNADLPIPRLGKAVSGIGVPSIVAARPFPRSASYRGTSWNAQGVIVKCPGGGLGSLEEIWDEHSGVIVLAVSCLGAIALWALLRKGSSC